MSVPLMSRERRKILAKLTKQNQKNGKELQEIVYFSEIYTSLFSLNDTRYTCKFFNHKNLIKKFQKF